MSTLILTDTGQAKVAAALAGGQPVRIEEVVAGDGGISSFTPASPQSPVWQPDAALTALPGERWRGAPADIHSDDAAGEVIISAVIPQQAGGWWLHAAGLIDDAGDLIAVAALEPVYVSTHRELTLTLRLAVSQASAISLQVPPTALATREWVAGAFNPVPDGKLGINATADATNRLAVKSDAVLFSYDDVTPGTGDVQFKVNKAAAANTASLLFQTGWSGRAELGLAGGDDFSVKVSADGATWKQALSIDGATGRMGVNTASPAGQLHVVGEDEGLTIENAQDPGAMFTIAAGRPGLYENDLIFSEGSDIADPSRYRMRITPWGPIFPKGIRIADGEGVTSETSGALAYYKPFDGARAELAFRGADNADTAEFRMYAWRQDGAGAWYREDAAAITDNAGLVVSQFYGAVRLPSHTVATLPSASAVGAGGLVFVSDESGGPTLAFSDGTNWRRVQDGSVVA